MLSDLPNISEVSEISDIPDLEIIRLYRQTKNPTYVLEILLRYKFFILKTISNWNSRNRLRVTLTSSDFKDVEQSAKLAVINMMNAVNLDKIKVLAVTIKSYVYNMLNKCYRYQKYEVTSGLVPVDVRTNAFEAFQEKENNERARQYYIQDTRLYYKYHCQYNYYKVGLMTTKSKKKKSMQTVVKKRNKLSRDRIHI